LELIGVELHQRHAWSFWSTRATEQTGEILIEAAKLAGARSTSTKSQNIGAPVFPNKDSQGENADVFPPVFWDRGFYLVKLRF